MSIEEQLIEKRAKMKANLKAQFIRQQYNPYRFINGNEPIFDPAVQRWMSMRACTQDFFKATPKTSYLGLLNILPVAVLTYIVHNLRAKNENMYRSGEISYRDRHPKFH
ncbi:NADH:ubiquinone oxidoreductase subunit NDUFB4 [Trinorchestia longiramus]|nr:NADH:ubiquinone oxidoreductase subunit NDUFB4 [Trinorchestia longiramus]